MKPLSSVFLGILLVLVGCHTITRLYDFEIAVVNLSKYEITENKVIDGTERYNYGAGILVPSSYAGNAGPMESPPDDVFTVKWKDDRKQPQEQKFDLRGRVKRGFKGEIVFVYGADRKFTVEVVNPPNRYPIPPQKSP
jgi:hypothetical protein